MREQKYAIVVDKPGHLDYEVLVVVSGRIALWDALIREITADNDFYWNTRIGGLPDMAKHGGEYYGHKTAYGISHTLSVWLVTDQDAQQMESQIDGGLW